ncbi:related to autophagy protein Atg27 [Phialocephala subalpina]|uniref:Autophagy-related protein 27 n=1 Tax=Phialocephala subalpina TaxID=576137 RepID=A0A1L7XLM5_9HELO|nr:related to autophagy protein Atg27 [Phialocephala subalpina]
MRIPYTSADAALLSAILLPGLAIASGTYDCGNIVIKGQQWKELKALGGPKSVLQREERASGFKNTTYTIDICKPLKRENKDIDCPNYARVCAVERDVSKDGKGDLLMDSWPLAGDLKDFGGKDLNAKWDSLSESDSNADSEKEGLRLTMNGGWHKVNDKKRPQKVVVEFLCDKTLVGDENLWTPEDEYDNTIGKDKRAEGDDPKDGEKEGDKEDDAKSPSLKFLKYDTSGKDADILRLEWRTKYACRDASGEKNRDPNGHWGFFTWFIIIAFLSTATYLIFGSWLNYNRYGARGWDLLPHGDTIRDVPYLMKDWMRRAMSTVQGGGSRGGYAAV